MRKRTRKTSLVLLAAASVFLAAGAAFASDTVKLMVNGRLIPADVPPQIVQDRAMVPIRWVAEALGAKVDWDNEAHSVKIDMPDGHSLERQVELLRDWIAPESADAAVQTWAKAVQQRNGAVQLAVLAPELQQQTRAQYEEMNWVTGVSSPWVDSYTISKGTPAGDGLAYDVEFKLATSTGSAGSGSVKVTVGQAGGKWAIVGLEEPSGGAGQLSGIVIFPAAPGADASVELRNPESVQMVDGNIGWVWGMEQGKPVLMRTNDGGKHWSNVALDGLQMGSTNIAEAYFDDAKTGWISWADERGLNIARTTDGGEHWNRTAFPGNDHPVAMTFVDAKRGWLLTAGDAGMMHNQKKVYRTEDGGESWKVVSSDTGYIPGDSPTANALPQVGYSSGMTFRNADDGFVAIDNPVSSELLFYATADGGANWQPVALPVPSSLKDRYDFTSLSAPVFSGEQRKDGVMLVKFGGSGGDTLVAYRTQDGGKTWSAAILPASIKVSGMERIAFADASNGWLIEDGILYRTGDGGATWSQVNADDTFAQALRDHPAIRQIAPQSNETVWLLCAPDDQQSARLLKTADGGQSWSAISLQASPET